MSAGYVLTVVNSHQNEPDYLTVRGSLIAQNKKLSIFKISNICNELTESLQSVVLGNGGALDITRSLIVGRILGLETVQIIHGIYKNEQKFNTFAMMSTIRNFMKIELEKRYIKKIKNLFALSQEIYDFVRNSNPNAEVYRVNNIVDPRYFRPRSYSSQSGEYRILFNAAITRRKNLMAALEGISFLKRKGVKANLKIVGPIFDNKYFEECQRKYIELFDGNEVEYLGVLSTADLINIYHNSDVLLLTSNSESVPMVISQAMAACLPVICSDVGGISEMLNHRCKYLFNPEKQSELNDCLLRGLKELRFGNANESFFVEERYQLAIQKYHANSFVKKLENLRIIK